MRSVLVESPLRRSLIKDLEQVLRAQLLSTIDALSYGHMCTSEPLWNEAISNTVALCHVVLICKVSSHRVQLSSCLFVRLADEKILPQRLMLLTGVNVINCFSDYFAVIEREQKNGLRSTRACPVARDERELMGLTDFQIT